MRPLWYPSKRHMAKQLLKDVLGWTACIIVFGGIGVMLAWRG